MAGAAKYTYGRYEVDDILTLLTDYDHNLWIAYNDEGVQGAVITEFVDYPRKRVLCMVFAGGKEVKKWKNPIMEMLQSWAFDNDCDGIEYTGRPGWAKIFSENGHRCVWHTYELPAGKSGLGESNG